MKLSVTTPLQIRNHPVNNSSAKVQWSFSRASRFKTPRPKYPSFDSVVLNLHTIIDLVSQKEKLHLVMEAGPHSLMAIRKDLIQANTKPKAISISKKKIKVSVLLQTVRIWFLVIMQRQLKPLLILLPINKIQIKSKRKDVIVWDQKQHILLIVFPSLFRLSSQLNAVKE